MDKSGVVARETPARCIRERASARGHAVPVSSNSPRRNQVRSDASPVTDGLPRTSPSVDRFGEQWNKEEPTWKEKNEQHRGVEDEPSQIPLELGLFVLGPFTPRVTLFHENAHEPFEVLNFPHDDVFVLSHV